MKTIGLYVAAALVLALVSAGFVAAGLLDRDMADAQQRALTSDYEPLAGVLDRAERYYGYASRLPWVGAQAVNDVRARRAALQYWQRQYPALLSNPAEPFAGIPVENVDLQLLVAGALYRHGMARVKDRATTLDALDVAIDAYQTVLKNAERQEEAAFNYEFLVRVRNEMNKGQRKTIPPAKPEDPQGSSGAPVEASDMSTFKVYVPLESGERTKSEGEAGKASPIKRKG